MVYCAPNPATALLEILVHAEIELGDIPVTYKYLEIHAPERTSRESIATAAGAQKQGDTWLQQNRSALLLVPCVIVPETTNILINPRHRDSARIKIKRIHEQTPDTRLTSRVSVPPA